MHVTPTPRPDAARSLRAITSDRYAAAADGLRRTQVPRLVPGEGEVLRRVHATRVEQPTAAVVVGSRRPTRSGPFSCMWVTSRLSEPPTGYCPK